MQLNDQDTKTGHTILVFCHTQILVLELAGKTQHLKPCP